MIETKMPANRPGRPAVYGEPSSGVSVHMPDSLKERIRREVLMRNVRDGDPESWRFSRVVVDILRRYFEQEG